MNEYLLLSVTAATVVYSAAILVIAAVFWGIGMIAARRFER